MPPLHEVYAFMIWLSRVLAVALQPCACGHATGLPSRGTSFKRRNIKVKMFLNAHHSGFCVVVRVAAGIHVGGMNLRGHVLGRPDVSMRVVKV